MGISFQLFELTLIATKYQYSVCQYPRDIVFIALNHLDSIRNTMSDSNTIQMAQELHHNIIGVYGKMSVWELQLLRCSVLNLLVDVQLKMTNLIKLGLQKETGEFVKEPLTEIHPSESNCDYNDFQL